MASRCLLEIVSNDKKESFIGSVDEMPREGQVFHFFAGEFLLSDAKVITTDDSVQVIRKKDDQTVFFWTKTKKYTLKKIPW